MKGPRMFALNNDLYQRVSCYLLLCTLVVLNAGLVGGSCRSTQPEKLDAPNKKTTTEKEHGTAPQRVESAETEASGKTSDNASVGSKLC